MKRTMSMVVAVLVGLGMLVAAPPAQSTQPTAKFKNCKQLWKKYPNGVAVRGSNANRSAFADYAVEDGFLRPKVLSYKKFNKIKPAKRFRTAGARFPQWLYCGRPRPAQVPPTPANFSAQPSTVSSAVNLVFQEPVGVYPPPVYDIYVNGALNSTYTTRVTPKDNVHTFTPLVFGLNYSTTYEMYVVARNEAGSSAPTPTVAVTTKAEPKRTYTLQYTAGCASGNCSVLLTNASGGTDRIDPTGGGTWTFEISKKSYEIYSIMVVDNTYSQATSCEMTLDGRRVEQASSSGGSSAYCGYITK